MHNAKYLYMSNTKWEAAKIGIVTHLLAKRQQIMYQVSILFNTIICRLWMTSHKVKTGKK